MVIFLLLLLICHATFRMTVLADRHKKDKHEFKFITRVGNWAYIIDDYVIVDNQFPILEHYHKKHDAKQ